MHKTLPTKIKVKNIGLTNSLLSILGPFYLMSPSTNFINYDKLLITYNQDILLKYSEQINLQNWL